MKLRHYTLIALLIGASGFRSSLLSQVRPDLAGDTLARIGSEGITGADLLRRLEVMPFPDKTKKVDSDTIKAMALRAMIAEKVLAHEQRGSGQADEAAIVFMHHELENALVRDELYRRHILENIRTSPEELTLGLNRIVHVNKVLALMTSGEEAARGLAKRLLQAYPDSLLKRIPSSMYSECDTLTIGYGAPDSSFETAAFAIGTTRVSPPFHSVQFGWGVLYLLNRASNPEVSSMSLADRSARVDKILRARHETELFEHYYAEVLKSRHASGDSAMFNILADSIVALWKEDTTHFRSKRGYILTGDLVDLLERRLAPFLNRTLVTLEDGMLSLGQVLEMFRYVDFQSKALEGMPFKAALNEAVRQAVGNELLAREGRKEGLQNDLAVIDDIRLWSDYWAARSQYYRVRDSVKVSNEEILVHLVKNAGIFGKYFEVNVREILCDSLGAFTKVLDEMGRGRSMTEMARELSKRREWAAHGGESGFFEVRLHPDLGFQALMTDSGKIAGPVKLPEGYSLSQVLGKRLTRNARTNFDILRRSVYNRLLAEKQKHTVDAYIADLARKERVSIDYGKLHRLSYNRIPMFTRRLIGFGGRMSAAPMLMRQWDWINEYLPPNEVIP